MNSVEKFFDSVDFPNIVENIRNLYMSDGAMNTLLDFERVLDESDLYAYKNWILGELVSGPITKKYSVICMFMYPLKLMPDPRAAKRLLTLGCTIKLKKTKIKVPVKIKEPDDYRPGTHYPKLVEKEVWLISIEIPKYLMNDVREGSVDIAEQSVDLSEIDEAYAEDLDKAETEEDQTAQQSQGMPSLGGPLGGPMPNIPGAPL